MKRLLPLLLLLGAGDARAGDRSIETWLGTWSGKAVWKDCTVGDAATVTVKVTWHDGGIWLDASGIYEGLGEVEPDVRAGDVLAFETDDVTVTLTPAKPPGKKGSKKKKARPATLSFATAAQCTMTAKLARDGSGDAACDGLAALEQVAQSCDVTPAEDDGSGCAARATALRAQLVSAECLAPDDDHTELAECRQVWAQAQRIQKCDAAPVSFKQGTIEHVGALRRELWHVDAATAAEHCTDSAKMLEDSADYLHCP